MKGRGFFITGTDTGCGKTHVTSGLMRAYARAGFRVAGMKPIASGATREGEKLVNADVEAIAAAANVDVGGAHINNYLFEQPARMATLSRSNVFAILLRFAFMRQTLS
jgi:dethiobiotin synthetase